MDIDLKTDEKPPKKPRGKTTDTREKILKAARMEFARHGFSGARTERILSAVGANPRMLYHYFGGKAGLYVEVLEEALARLRKQELKIDLDHLSPQDGLIQLFEHMHSHFESDKTLVRLLRSENLEEARFMKTSRRIKEMSSPVLRVIDKLLERGVASGTIRPGIDPLQLYVIMVALNQFHLSNAHTMSVIFDRDLLNPTFRAERHMLALEMFTSFLRKAQ